MLMPGPIRWTPARTQLVGATPCLVHEGGTEGVLVYAHGNGECLGSIDERMQQLARTTRTTVIAFQYPGYGAAGGKRRACLAVEAMRFVLGNARKMAGKRPLTVVGQSVGAGIAAQVVQLSTEFDKYPMVTVDNLVLISPFSSVADMADHLVGYGAGSLSYWTSRQGDVLDTVDAIRQLQVPLQVIHGDRDELIPMAQARKVFDASPAAHRSWNVTTGGHNDMDWGLITQSIHLFLGDTVLYAGNGYVPLAQMDQAE